ncbi:MAG: S41 family peptidase [Acidobacteriota bacterium]
MKLPSISLSTTRCLIIGLILMICVVIGPMRFIAEAQPDLNFQRERGRMMLKVIKDDLKKNYYDSTIRGMDIEARFKTADEKIKTAESVGQVFGIIAQVLLDLDDSHTFFLPPGRSNRTDYGWRMQSVGGNCFVNAVKPGSDAEAKGLKVGDQILSINAYQPSRENLWLLEYLFNTLRPQPGLSLVVKKPDGQQRQLDVMAKIKQGKLIKDLTSTIDYNDYVRESEDEDRLSRPRHVEVGDNLMIYKMPDFSISESAVDDMIGKARKRPLLILDLRGNPGGYVKTLEWMMGYFTDKEDLKIADYKGRKEMKPQIAKLHKGQQFKGKLAVLIDSESGSAAEIFARAIQLEKRGIVIGDRSAGAVMRSRRYGHELGNDTVVFYGASITDADVIMTDGKSLEKVGVTPDELVLPTAKDMAAGRDVALSRAAAILGAELSPEKAGTFFPIEWKK